MSISEPSTMYPKAALLPSIKFLPAGFSSASYKKKKNCEDPSSTDCVECDQPRAPGVAKGKTGVEVYKPNSYFIGKVFESKKNK